MTIDYSGFAHPKNPAVRLEGEELEMLRLKCLTRDRGRCQCGCNARVDDSLPDWHPLKYDMAHIVSRGAGGSDTIDNVRTLAHGCHMAEHAGQILRVKRVPRV